MTADKIHIMPIGDLRDHEETSDCWCQPMTDDEYPEILIHNAMDRREHTIEKGLTQ